MPQQVKPWLQILQALLVSDKVEIQHRASYVTLNLMAADKDIATRLIESRVSLSIMFTRSCSFLFFLTSE